MDIIIFFLIAVIGILIIYILVREQIVKNEIEDLEEYKDSYYTAEARSEENYKKVDKIDKLIKEEETKELKDKNSYSLIRKIKEVITSDQTR